MHPWGRASRAGGTRARYTRAIVRPLVAFSRLDTQKSINLGGGALTVSWLRSFVHHLCVFVG